MARSTRVLSFVALTCVCAVAIGWMASSAGAGDVRSPWDDVVGRFAVVQLVHEPLDPEGSLGSGTTTRARVVWRGSSYNKVTVEVFGRVASVDERWVVLEDIDVTAAESWVPRERVHLMEVVSEEEMKQRRMTH